MNEKLKTKIEQLKIQAKKHGPAVLGVVGTVIATVVAVHYKNEIDRLIQTDDDLGWTNIPVPRDMVESLEDGHTLHYRRVRVDNKNHFTQCSTSLKSLGFNPEMDERFEKAKTEAHTKQ